jgi:hypothetical protein
MRECSFFGREADELMAVHVERHMMIMAQVSTSRQRQFAVGDSRDGRPSTTSLAVVRSTGSVTVVRDAQPSPGVPAG